MKKLVLYILGIIGIIIPFSASASSVSLNVSCKDVIVGNTTTCTVYASPSNGINGAVGTISVSGSAASLTSVSKGVLSNGDLSNSSFALYGDTFNGKVALFTMNFSAVSVGENTITVSSTFSDADFEDVPQTSATGKLVVSPKPTAATTTTTTRQTVTHVTQATMATTQITVPTTEANTLHLTSLKVGDFPVEERNGVYYVTTDPDTESVDIYATAPEGVIITGMGKRNLGVGTNSVNLSLANGSGGTAIISILITRPEGGDSNVLLKELGVIDAELKFDPNTKEYTVSVPYDTKEIFVYATAQSPDASIKGDGKYTLEGKDTNVYVTVSFGDKTNTTYKIHIVKEYKGLVPMIALGAGLFIALLLMIYFMVKYGKTKKQLRDHVVATKANRLRITEEEGPQMSVNGVSATGIGARVIKPKAVEATSLSMDDDKEKEMVHTYSKEEEFDHEPAKIVESRPTTVQGMVPPKEIEKEEPKVAPQVKVVKRIVNPTTGEVRFITVTQKADK